MTTTHSEEIFQVGDQVRVNFGSRKLAGVVVEDRGGIGVRGRHLFAVNVFMDPFEPMLVELPGEDLERAPTMPPISLNKQQVIDYLTNGGLISILRANIAGGKNQPRVWLRPDNTGNVTHTFIPERGVVGGEIIPFWAMHEQKVFAPKQDAIISFLQSFNLSHREAEQIVSAIGTAP
jgi:hypothetical protein